MSGKVTSTVEKRATGLGLEDSEGLGQHQLCLPLTQASSLTLLTEATAAGSDINSFHAASPLAVFLEDTITPNQL